MLFDDLNDQTCFWKDSIRTIRSIRGFTTGRLGVGLHFE
jgi:hypothetical protein